MRIFTLTLAIILITCASAFADIVYFKDGGEVEGLITERAESYIVIDIGFGTMTVRRDEIDRIEESSPQRLDQLKKEKLSQEIERGDWAAEGYEDIRKLYQQTKESRTALREARKKGYSVRSGISKSEDRLTELFNLLDMKGRTLKGMDAQRDVKKYNDIVSEMNSINVQLNDTNNRVKELYESEKKVNEELTKIAGLYRSDFQLFRSAWEEKRNSLKKDMMDSEDRYFFEEMNRQLKEMEGDFIKETARYTPESGHIFVDATLNDKTTARLIVDTGASIVLISTAVAGRLGISYDDIRSSIDMVMADGRTVEAKPVVLSSVKVGNATIKNVHAAIIEKEAVGGVDGLLGMSFLSNFVIKVDSATNTLILERVM